MKAQLNNNLGIAEANRNASFSIKNGHVMLHALVHPFRIHSSFPKWYTALSLSVFMGGKLTLPVTLEVVGAKLEDIWLRLCSM